MKKTMFLMACALLSLTAARAQVTYGPSDPSPAQECGEYLWPEVSSPCPEVQIKQKHDHTPYPQYRAMGWDMAVTCDTTTIELSCMPYIPVKYFTGQYTVDVIPYDPPDTTFHGGSLLNITSDDIFCGTTTNIPFNFYFFGIKKTGFVVGSNGMLTFNTTDAVGQSCPWSLDLGDHIPWNNSYASQAKMRDAIFGIYEDTHPIPNYTNNSAPYYQGIWYGIQGSYPCRKIICNWNDVATYNASDNGPANHRCTYQIVCYEGSNIIEVHIKKRMLDINNTWNDLQGIIGILNSTNNPQVPSSTIGATNYYVDNGAPAAFFPANYNPFTTAAENIAFRFTPQGNTPKQYRWYRIFDDGRDSVVLTTNPDDTNGYTFPMGHMNTCPNLTRAIVTPTCVSRYVFELIFTDANTNPYFLRDTITIGMDTANNMTLRPTDSVANTKVYNICQGTAGNLLLEYPSLQKEKNKVYTVTRMSDGVPIELDINDVLTLGETSTQNNLTQQTVTLSNNLPTTGLRSNKIDSIYVQVSIEFISGCNNYDRILVKVYPNFDTTEIMKICKGESYTWNANGQTYNQTVNATANLHSAPGCDSTVHLDLTVLETSLTVDHVTDCKPYTWINGVTYETSNTATSATDIVIDTNIWGCDSVVQLDLTILPLTARIGANRTFFDYDMLDVVLNDISTNGDSRLWVMPGGLTSTSATLYYTIPADADSADITMIATSAYGCADTTNIVIPMRKESFWIPNAFTPDNSYGNRIFSSISTKTLSEEMYIYNRNGQLVFKCEGPDCPWDGRDLNGNLCPQGVYTYVIRYTNEFLPKQTQVRRGTVTLIR